MKRFTNKQECLKYLTDRFESAKQAMDNKGYSWEFKGLGIVKVAEAFRVAKHTDLDSKQQLEQRVVDSFGDLKPNDALFMPSDSYQVFNPDAVEVKETISNRTANYGEFEVNSKIMQDMKDAAKSGSSWDKMSSYQKESIEMILHKVGRIVCGDPDYIDSWHDIAGYAKLVEDILDSAKRAVELNDAEVE